MTQAAGDQLSDLPDNVARALGGVCAAARTALGPDLVAIVLFGSAADGQLRPTSDVNVIFVLARWPGAALDGLRDLFRAAHAAVQLEAMFLLQDEIDAAVAAFSVKFADVLRRRRVIHGSDPFSGVKLSRPVEIARLKQVLLNLTLRLRERYVLVSLREEQAALVIADAAGPLRSFAATLLELEGRQGPSGKQALDVIAGELPPPVGGHQGWAEILASLSHAREQRSLPAGGAAPALLRLVDLTNAMRARAERLS